MFACLHCTFMVYQKNYGWSSLLSDQVWQMCFHCAHMLSCGWFCYTSYFLFSTELLSYIILIWIVHCTFQQTNNYMDRYRRPKLNELPCLSCFLCHMKRRWAVCSVWTGTLASVRSSIDEKLLPFDRGCILSCLASLCTAKGARVERLTKRPLGKLGNWRLKLACQLKSAAWVERLQVC
jgi:hypothetical protein